MSSELPQEDDFLKREQETNSETLIVRLTPSLLKRIDAYAERLSKQRLGIKIIKAEVVRSLLAAALDEVEGKKRR